VSKPLARLACRILTTHVKSVNPLF
jgi:hypothetical protein